MCKLEKMLVVASEMFKDENVSVSIGTRNPTSGNSDLTILLGGRIEFNSYKHRRDAFDLMLYFNLWIKKVDGMFLAGVHDDKELARSKSACVALTHAAYQSLNQF